LIKYSVLRLALFVGSLMLLYGVGVRPSVLLLALAAGISLALSYLLLGKQRSAVAQEISDRIEGRLQRRQAFGQSDAEAEDAASERQRDGQ
jgi:hypothetical protein